MTVARWQVPNLVRKGEAASLWDYSPQGTLPGPAGNSWGGSSLWTEGRGREPPASRALGSNPGTHDPCTEMPQSYSRACSRARWEDGCASKPSPRPLL